MPIGARHVTSMIGFIVLLSASLFAAPAARQTSTQSPPTISGTVTTRADGMSVPNATVTIAGTKASTTTDNDGTYSIEVPPALARTGRVQLHIQALGLPAKTYDVQLSAVGTTTFDVALTLGFEEQVTVGSRSPGVEAEKSVPVDVLTKEQIAASGYSETAQVIQALAPSFNFPRPTITDGTDTVRPATLRGLGPDQVLVLINGKRRHQSALVHLNGSIGRGSTGVDLNAIPLSSIERIEVLREGAAAQYGSDAIAGVINIVLKGGTSAPAITSKFGLSTGSFTGNECTPSGSSCQPGEKIDFSDGELFDVGGSWGLPVSKGSLTVAAEYRHHNRTNRASFDPRDQIVGGDAGNNAVPEPNHRWGDPDTRDLMTFVNGNFPLNTAQTRFVYAFGGFSRREANSAGFFRRSLDARNWPQIYPLGFLPEIQPTVVDISGAAGVRGATSGWSWDVSGEYGYNNFDFTIGNTLNVSLGPSIPPNKTEFDAGSLALGQFVANVDITRRFDVDAFSGPVNVAFGSELRREQYQINAGEPDSYGNGGVPNQAGTVAAIGSQVFPGFRPSNEVDESRSNIAGYVDVEGDVLEWLRIGLAGRAEHYTDFGNTFDGKLTVRVQPDRRFVVRGSLSSGFRAPSLGQSFFSSTATNFLTVPGQGLVPFESLTLPVNSAAALVLGAQPLKPEESTHAGAGIAVTPVPGLDITVDYYRIDIDDRIVLSGNFTSPRITELLAPFGANSARFFTNAIDTRTNGVDVTASYGIALADAGNLRLNGAYNHTQTDIVGTVTTPPQLAGLELQLFDRIERRRIECGQPQDNLRAGADWRRARWGAFVNLARYGEFCSFTASPTDDQTFEPKWLTDVEVSFRIAPNLTLGAGAQNLFNVFPDRNIVQNSFSGIQTFPSHSPFGMNGRSIYGRLAVNLR
ncbi:MAG TPA: TonB-dependent receptor [Vicinamibacterales bacterium]|nr:TonB-dependent receptor [Vicinamibacterales bacterium]